MKIFSHVSPAQHLRRGGMLLAVAGLILGCLTLQAQQLPPPNEMGVSMRHLHLNVQDIEANKKFWVTVGGTISKVGKTIEVVKVGDLRIAFIKAEPSGPAAGSVVGHFSFVVPNVQQSMAKWQAAGLKTEAGRNARQGFVYTPDGLIRVEFLEDSSLTVPIAFHHIHFFVADSGSTSAVPEIQAWYAKLFGAKPGKRPQEGGPLVFDNGSIPGAELTYSKSNTPTVGTKGRALDHIGFQIKDLEAFCKKLEAAGVKFDVPYRKVPALGISIAFLTDPWGAYIELTEGLNKL